MNIKFDDIKLITDSFGNNKREAIIFFKKTNEAKNFINKYHNDFIHSNLGIKNIMVKLFDLKTNENKIKITNKVNQLMLYNLPYELNNNDIKDMTKDYGEIIELQLPLRNNEKNKGFCFIEFKRKEEAKRFIENFEDKLVYGRKLKIQSKYYKCDPSFSQIQTSKSNKFVEQLKNDNINIYNSLFEYSKNKFKEFDE